MKKLIAFLSKWAEGIVIAVIIATIIELILPNNQNKKYVKMIVGVYIVFTIISPIIDKFSSVDLRNITIENIIEEDTKITSSHTVDYTNNYITTLYIKNLQKDMNSKLEAKGYGAKKIEVQVNEEVEEMPIKKIGIEEIYKKQEGIQAVNKIEIMAKEQEQEKITNEEQEKIREYFSQTYAVLKENIEIK